MSKVIIYTDGAARGNPDGREAMERYFSLSIQRDSFMKPNILPDIRRLPITAWN